MERKELKELIKKSKQEQEEWDNSIEGVLYDLKTWGAEDNKHTILIAKTLLKLPKRIRRKVLDEVVFVIMSYASGTVLNAHFTKDIKKADFRQFPTTSVISIKQPLIILNFEGMKKGREMDVIAHEIAHFILKNYPLTGKPASVEKETDDLTERWGFKRGYKSYKELEKIEKLNLKK